MSKILLTFLCFLFSLSLFAYTGEYRLGIYNGFYLDYNSVTHIIVVGSAVKEDSDQFFQSGLSRAIRYKEVYPNEQVVIISSPEVIDRSDSKVFSDFGLFVAKTVKETLVQEKLIEELKLFTKIQSLDFFGHSSPWGFKLGKKGAAFVPSEVESKLVSLKANLMTNAYATITSCNSGFSIAPDLSAILSIPVAGTLTSGLFERIEADGHWYKEDDWNSGNFVEENIFSFSHNFPCLLTGACVRMKPSRHNYSSYWGNFKEGGLSFSKFFCNFDNVNNKCEVGMATSLLTFPSVRSLTKLSSEADFKDVVYDWICQTAKDRSFFNACVKGIEDAILRGDLVFKSHTGNELNCDFKSCHAKVVCKEKVLFGNGPKAGSCHLEAIITDRPTNAVREALSFLTGFKMIKSM